MNTSTMRLLGRSGIQVSALGLGCWAIGGPFWRGETPVGWGKVEDAESIRAIHAALDLGINFFDTSDVYGAGHSERILGQALKGRRQQAVIATKFGNLFDEQTRQITGADASPGYIRRACEASLQRLNTDYIDLYQLHLGGYDLDGAREVRETLEALVSEGWIRSYGWSTDDPERVRLFAQGTYCSAIQNQMNVFNDASEIIDLCTSFNLASINRGPLAMGLLTGKFQPDSTLAEDDVRGARAPEWMSYFKDGRPNPVFMEKLDAVRQVLVSGGRSLAQGALAWLWGRSTRTIPIPGFKTSAQVEENCAALQFGPLSKDQVAEIDRILGR